VNPALSFLIAARRSEMQGLAQLRATSDLVRDMSEFVHRLQRERGACNLFLASRGQRFAAERAQCLADSQALESAVRERHFSARTDPSLVYGGQHGGMRLLSRIAQLLHALDGLPALRQQGALRLISADDNTRAYSDIVSAMLAVVFEAADTAADPSVSRALVALFNLMQGKELAGQERATGTAACAAGVFDAPLQQRLAHLQEAQERCFQAFHEFAEAPLRAIWAHFNASADVAELARWRLALREDGAGAFKRAGVGQGTGAGEAWFAAATRRIDALRLVEDAATSALVALCEERLTQAQRELQAPEAALAQAAAGAGWGGVTGPGGLQPEGLGPLLGRSILDLVQEQALRLQRMGDELAAAQAAMRERKLVERAKGLLMDRRGLSEEAAYRLLRQTAMHQHKRLGDVAEAVLQMGPLIDGL